MSLGSMPPPRPAGFTYVAMLFALVIFGLGLAAIGEAWSAASHRAKETELIETGGAYARAIGQYYQHAPGSQKAYPMRLGDLVEDRRFVGTVRYLRRLYRDPFTNGQQWGVVRAPDGGIAGVFSLSDKATLRKQPLWLRDGQVVLGARYSDWKFVYQAKP